MSDPDYEPTVDCRNPDCDGEWHVLLDGTAICDSCPHVETQWTKPRKNEPVENAREFQGYVDGIAEYVHCDFSEWYEDYMRLLDVYYKRRRGWPSEEAKQKFNDLYMMAPVKLVQLLEERDKQREKLMQQAKQGMADKVNRHRNKSV